MPKVHVVDPADVELLDFSNANKQMDRLLAWFDDDLMLNTFEWVEGDQEATPLPEGWTYHTKMYYPRTKHSRKPNVHRPAHSRM